MKPMKKLNNLFINLTLLITVCVALWMIGEVAATFCTPTSRIVESKNKRLIYELNSSFPQINSFGMRDDLDSIEDLSNEYIIAAIGDSHTYSVEVDNSSKTYPARLEHHLNKLTSKNDYKVLNFGVPGYNTAQELELLRSKVISFRPNMVILQYCVNDTHICNWMNPQHPRLNQLIHKSHLLPLIWKQFLYRNFETRPKIRRIYKSIYTYIGKKYPDALLYQPGLVGALTTEPPTHPTDDPNLVPSRYHYMLGVQNLKKSVQEFSEVCQKNNILPVATGFIGPQEKAIFEEAGFYIISFYDLMSAEEMIENGYNPSNTGDHFNDRGCDRLGRLIAKNILGSGSHDNAPLNRTAAKRNSRA